MIPRLRISEIRQVKGISQRKLAKLMDMEQPQLYRLESTSSQSAVGVQLGTLIRLSRALGVTIDDLVVIDDEG